MTLIAGGSLDPKGPAAESVADLWWLLAGLGAIPFLLVMVLLVGGAVPPALSRGARDQRAGRR
ncbi:MAG: hypothetical protein GEV08_18220 [Acidimicrobiia bacterium]|nr:hypothetical protein [Acidimicrobiia bacterium]